MSEETKDVWRIAAREETVHTVTFNSELTKEEAMTAFAKEEFDDIVDSNSPIILDVTDAY